MTYSVQYRVKGLWFEFVVVHDMKLAKRLEKELKATFETRIVPEK